MSPRTRHPVAHRTPHLRVRIGHPAVCAYNDARDALTRAATAERATQDAWIAAGRAFDERLCEALSVAARMATAHRADASATAGRAYDAMLPHRGLHARRAS